MKHLGDITKISGYDVPIVDCIIGGSPCQDLSVAGKRAGLDGERSGLYMEQIRIVKEMRERDERNGRSGVDIRPRYMVWENVPGAFSSNKGEDFRIVLEEIAKVCDKDAVIPMPDKGKWTNSGSIVADGWSVAWRVLDAQFWGVPQRRRRIALVADFGGESAQEILFVGKGVSGHTDESKPKGKGTSSDAQRGIGVCDRERGQTYHNGRSGGDLRILQEVGGDCIGSDISNIGADGRERVYCIEPGAAKRLGGYVCEGLAPTLRTEVGDNRPSVAYGISSYNSNAMKSDNPHSGIYEADTSRTLDGNGGNPSCNQGGIAIVESVPYTLKIRSGCEGGGKGALVQEDKSATLATNNDQYLFQPVDALDRESYQDKVGALCAIDYKGIGSQYVDEGKLIVEKDPSAVCYGINGDKAGTLDSSYFKGCGMRSGVERDVVAVPIKTHYIVRRLTPLECERLQGYPDGWTDIGEWVDSNGKKRQTSDAARYKALGNSIALPPWKWVLKRLCACYERDATMASLFDGIGGFPYLWEQLNGKGTCLWASEIEEFPMAVTKVRIGGDT
jgi:DNA (cytosine-5)-methyltransferase 1